MSQLMLDHVGSLLQKVSQDVRSLGDTTTVQMDKVMEALDDIAATVLALKAISAVQLKHNPLDVAEVEGWLKQHLGGTMAEDMKSVAILRHMVKGEE
ncbi:MAG: hypothetical protein K2Q10_14575 [Rhodospirillales bacterium]|nr:hypothetical protein [Rhodospirillales bacterium]